MIIAAGICTFQDSLGLNRCLSSLGLDKEHGIDYAIVVDGKFDSFDWPTELSTDGTVEVCEAYERSIRQNPALVGQVSGRSGRNVHSVTEGEIKTQRIRYLPRPNLPEFRKRQEYLVECTRLGVDILVIIDSDMYVEKSDWLQFRQNIEEMVYKRDECKLNVYDTWVENTPNTGTLNPRPVVWYDPGNMHYTYAHYLFSRVGSNIVGTCSSGLIEGITIRHDTKLRTNSQREEKAVKYKQYIQSAGL